MIFDWICNNLYIFYFLHFLQNSILRKQINAKQLFGSHAHFDDFQVHLIHCSEKVEDTVSHIIISTKAWDKLKRPRNIHPCFFNQSQFFKCLAFASHAPLINMEKPIMFVQVLSGISYKCIVSSLTRQVLWLFLKSSNALQVSHHIFGIFFILSPTSNYYNFLPDLTILSGFPNFPLLLLPQPQFSRLRPESTVFKNEVIGGY